MLGILFSVLLLVALIFTVVNIVTSDNWQIRYLDKTFWVIIVIFVPLVGIVVWWLIGKDRSGSAEPSGFARPQRAESPRMPQPAADLTDEEIDAAVEREIAFHEREAEIRRLEAQVRAKHEEK